jgi:hypoxanthine-guanine phosphoribosyltransferase
MNNFGQIRTKKSVKNLVINTLTTEWPLSIRKIYNRVRGKGVDVTYQAVFKAVKELIKQGILIEDRKMYAINIGWIKRVQQLVDKIRSNYESRGEPLKRLTDIPISDPRVAKFLSKLGNKIMEYFGKTPGCVIAIEGSGTLFGLGIKLFLLDKGIHVNYAEVNRYEPKFYKKDVEGRKVIIVNTTLTTGSTMKRIMRAINLVRRRYRIKDVKYVVGYDKKGLADLSAFQQPYIPFEPDLNTITILG